MIKQHSDYPRLYLLGDGLSPYAPKLYAEAEALLRDAGYEVINPVGGTAPTNVGSYLPDALPKLFDADAVATLPGHQRSDVAKVVDQVARVTGMKILTYDEWLDAAGEPA